MQVLTSYYVILFHFIIVQSRMESSRKYFKEAVESGDDKHILSMA